MNRRRLMMLKKSGGGLPEGYTAVDYLQSTGTQYIDTGRKLTQDSDITIDFMIVGKINRSAGMFGSRESAYEKNLAMFQTTSPNIFAVDFPNIQNIVLRRIRHWNEQKSERIKLVYGSMIF